MDTNNMQPVQQPDDLQARKMAEISALQQAAAEKQAAAKAGPKIGENEIVKAGQILQKYKAGKAMLEKKIIANEQFWKLRQWNYMNDGKNDFKPATAWLWSCIQSRYSDAMDSYPTCNFQPRQKDDQQEAIKLSSIVPVIMEQNRYEDTYSDVVWYTLKHGGSVQGVFWNPTKNGLGDIDIKKIDLLNLFWEPGITDLQQSKNIFHTELCDNETLEERYPQCVGHLGGKGISVAKYLYDDSVDTSDKSVVVDWYYKRQQGSRTVVHFAKFVNDVLLYATENEITAPETMEIDQQTGIPVVQKTGQSMAESGLYDHGKYPFVSMALYPVEGSICGYGITDIGRDTQLQLDKLNKAIIDNAIVTSKPRYFIRNDGSVNEEEFADISNDFVHVEGTLNDDYIKRIEANSLAPIYQNIMLAKIDEMKYITSNQDVNNGAAPSGITAASAIAALQETSGKNSRSSNKAFHRAYREVCYQVVELIRQFYDMPRCFRIVPDAISGAMFMDYDNSGLRPQQMDIAGMPMGMRLPEFDIDVTAEKANPYKKMENNELALQFYNAGFFNPQMTDQALACLNMMDFTKRDDVMQQIQRNGTLQEMLLRYQQLSLQLAQRIDPSLAEQIGQMIMQNGQQVSQGAIDVEAAQASETDEPVFMDKARAQARESTQVQ